MTNKEAIEELKKVSTIDMPIRLCEAYYMSLKALEQESKIDVLDKIRAEIAEYKDDKVIHDERNGMIDIVLEIIDKYRESGGKK